MHDILIIQPWLQLAATDIYEPPQTENIARQRNNLDNTQLGSGNVQSVDISG